MRIFLAAILIMVSIDVKSQSITINRYSVGIIVYDSIYPVATGFVAGRNNYVITSAHVVDSTHKLYYLNCRSQMHRLKIKKILVQEDIALLESEEVISYSPLVIKNTFDVSALSTILIIAYDKSISPEHDVAFKVNSSIVSAVGKQGTIDYFQYRGHALGGYSGAPIFNMKNEVIGIHEGSLYDNFPTGQKAKNADVAHSLILILKYF